MLMIIILPLISVLQHAEIMTFTIHKSNCCTLIPWISTAENFYSFNKQSMCDGKGGVTRYVVVQCTFFFSYFVTIDWSDIMDYSHRDGITFTCCYNHYYNGSSCVRK